MGLDYYFGILFAQQKKPNCGPESGTPDSLIPVRFGPNRQIATTDQNIKIVTENLHQSLNPVGIFGPVQAFVPVFLYRDRFYISFFL